jgi:Flp pilus assembly protein TadD
LLAFARQRFSEALALFREAQRIDPADKNASAGMVASLTNSGVEPERPSKKLSF